MPTKNLHHSLIPSHDGSSAAAVLVNESTWEASPESFLSAITSCCSQLRDHQLVLASLVAEAASAPRPSLSHRSVDQRLFEAAKLIAKLLEIAERADERATHARLNGKGSRAMRALAGVCFESILSIDAARHELEATIDADASTRRRSWCEALRSAQEALTAIERQVTRALAN